MNIATFFLGGGGGEPVKLPEIQKFRSKNGGRGGYQFLPLYCVYCTFSLGSLNLVIAVSLAEWDSKGREAFHIIQFAKCPSICAQIT